MRRKPYTKIGISRLFCFKCKKNKANQQWQICADDNTFRPICTNCDLELNEIVLKWAGFKDYRKKMTKYAKKFI